MQKCIGWQSVKAYINEFYFNVLFRWQHAFKFFSGSYFATTCASESAPMITSRPQSHIAAEQAVGHTTPLPNVYATAAQMANALQSNGWRKVPTWSQGHRWRRVIPTALIRSGPSLGTRRRGSNTRN